MNLRFLKNYDEQNCRLISENKILETEYADSKYGVFQNVRFFVYDTSTNERYEILPKVYKITAINVVNAEYNSNKIYFIQYLASDEDINVISYDLETEEVRLLHTFKSKLNEFAINQEISFFILNENNFILQTAFLRDDVKEGYRDAFFKFESTLYNIRENKQYNIVDENIINNGITDISPLSETQSMMKLGYNLLKDKRYEFVKKVDASVESVSIVNISQFISDISIMQNGIVLDSLDQSFYTQTIPRATVNGDYIIYSKYDIERKQELTTFYNYKNKDSYSCLNKNIESINALTNAMIISDKPYVKLKKAKKTDFFNIMTKKIDISVKNDRTINAAIDNIFIISEFKKSSFGRQKEFICIYKYPTMNMLHSEKGIYTGSLYNKESDTLYIFVE